MSDVVNHPAHYTDGKIEVIDFIEDKKLGFHLGNTVKYICRAGKKDPEKTIEDLQMAEWYLHREIQNLKAEKAKEEAQRWVDDVRRHCEKRFSEMMEEISKREEQSEPEGAMSVDPTQVDIDWETLKERAGQIAAGAMSEDFKRAVYEAGTYKRDTIDAAPDPRDSSVSKAMMEAIAKQEEADEDGPAPDQDPVDWIVNGPRMTILTPEGVQS